MFVRSFKVFKVLFVCFRGKSMKRKLNIWHWLWQCMIRLMSIHQPSFSLAFLGWRLLTCGSPSPFIGAAFLPSWETVLFCLSSRQTPASMRNVPLPLRGGCSWPYCVYYICAQILSLFWFHDGEIRFEACLTQVLLINSCSTMESGFFLALAFDLYVAICNPLRHSAILTHSVTWGMGLAIVFRGTALLFPHPFLLWCLPYFETNIISHTYCEFMTLIKIAFAETRIRRAYSFIIAFLTGGVEFILIICSYVLIFYTVFYLPSKNARLKTLGTCGSHVCVISVSYTLAFFSF